MSQVSSVLKAAVCAVALVPLQSRAATTDYIQNPDFSQVAAGMPDYWYPAPSSYNVSDPSGERCKVWADSTVFHAAAPSCCIAIQRAPNDTDFHFYQLISGNSALANKVIDVSAWVKTDSLAPAGVQIVVHEGVTSTGWTHLAWDIVGAAGGTTDWTQIKKSIQLGLTNNVTLRIFIPKATPEGGKVWVDDFEVEVKASPVRYSLLQTDREGIMLRGSVIFFDQPAAYRVTQLDVRGRAVTSIAGRGERGRVQRAQAPGIYLLKVETFRVDACGAIPQVR